MAEELIESIGDEYGLRPLWEAIYDIYAEVAKVCDKHGLRYYALGGTLLGAMRHNGFIPWDDDLDLAMPRPDYDKFMALADSELPSHLKFFNWEKMPGFPMMFGKVQETRGSIVLAMEKRLGRVLSHGIYIDIFPLDGYTDKNKFWIKLRDAFLLPIERFRMYKYGELSVRGKLAWIVGMMLSCFVPWMRRPADFFRIHEKTLRRVDYDSSEWVADCSLSFNLFRRAPQRRVSWGVAKPHPFNGKTMMIPANPDEPLRSRFGKNYMTLPPVEDRHPTHDYGWHCSWWLGPKT